MTVETTPCELSLNQLLSPSQAKEPRCRYPAVTVVKTGDLRAGDEVYRINTALCTIIFNADLCPDILGKVPEDITDQLSDRGLI